MVAKSAIMVTQSTAESAIVPKCKWPVFHNPVQEPKQN